MFGRNIDNEAIYNIQKLFGKTKEDEAKIDDLVKTGVVVI